MKKNPNTAQETEPTTSALPPGTAGDPLVLELLERLKKLEAERADRDSEPGENKNKKEAYKGPLWGFRYKIFNGKAVVKTETLAMNTVKNNITNKYITVHEVLVTYADGTTEKLDYDFYSQLLTWSKEVLLHEINDVRMDTLTFNNKGEQIVMKNHKFWTFTDTPHGTFEIAELFIN